VAHRLRGLGGRLELVVGHPTRSAFAGLRRWVVESLEVDSSEIWASAAEELRAALHERVEKAPKDKTAVISDASSKGSDIPSRLLSRVEALPVNELKAELRVCGIEYGHCVEKCELRALLVAALAGVETGDLTKDNTEEEKEEKKIEEEENSKERREGCDNDKVGAKIEDAVVVEDEEDVELADTSQCSHQDEVERLPKPSKSKKKGRDKKKAKKRKRKEKKLRKKLEKAEHKARKYASGSVRSSKAASNTKHATNADKDKKDKSHKRRGRNEKRAMKRKKMLSSLSSLSSASGCSSSSHPLKPEELAAEFTQAAQRGDVVHAQHVVYRHGLGFRSSVGDGPLHIAARSNQPALVDFLLRQRGAESLLEARNRAGETALLVAARLCRGRVALRLVEALADPAAIDNAGESPEALDLDGLVCETERDEECLQTAAGGRLLGAVSAARKQREDLEWRARIFEEEADFDFVRFEGYDDLERKDTGSNDWMHDIAQQAAARASAERLARRAMAAAAAAQARERDRAAQAEAEAERVTGPTPRPTGRASTSGMPSGVGAGTAGAQPPAREERALAVESEEVRVAARVADEARWQEFQLLNASPAASAGVPPTLRLADVPFPTGPQENPLRLDPASHPAVLRSQLRAGILRWHPDKFEQRFGRLLPAQGAERESVLGRVKAIAQQLNQLMRELLPEASKAASRPPG